MKLRLNLESFREVNVLVLLENSSLEYVALKNPHKYYDFLNKLKKNYTDKVLFKYHPCETNFYFGKKNLISDLPSEIVLLALPNIKFVIGLTTTGLYNSLYINESIKPMSFLDFLKNNDKNLRELFEEKGIILPQSFDSAYEMIEKHMNNSDVLI